MPSPTSGYHGTTFLPENALDVAHVPIPYPLINDDGFVFITAPFASDELAPEPFGLSLIPSLLAHIRDKAAARSVDERAPMGKATHSQYLLYWHQVCVSMATLSTIWPC